jgi:hypothetical protein
VFEQAAALAVVAAFSPTAMLIAALYLATANPRRMTALYVLGGSIIVTVSGTAVLLAIRAGGLSLRSQHEPRYGLRLGLGVLALVAAVVIYRRKPEPREAAKQKKPSPIDRLLAQPKPRTAFVVGILIFGPGLTFIAAVQVVATAKASVAATIVAMAMIIVITLAFAWIPLLLHVFAPEFARRTLSGCERWLRQHGKRVLVGGVGLIGIYLVAQGIIGLV